MKTVLTGTLVLIVSCSFLLTGCKGKTEQPPPQQTQMQPEAVSPHGSMPAPERVTALPDSVKGKWTAVKIEVLYKEKNERKLFEIPLESTFSVPDSDIVVSVGQFFPEFTLDGNTYTSVSNELINPATNVEVKQQDNLIFKGWLFSNYPTVHPFENDKYGITLVGGVPAK